jgi:hypothetical protein
MGTTPVAIALGCAPVPLDLFTTMTAFSSLPCWLHRGCRIELIGYPRCDGAYLIQHSSGTILGRAASLQGARQLIDDQIQLLRQRLAAAA